MCAGAAHFVTKCQRMSVRIERAQLVCVKPGGTADSVYIICPWQKVYSAKDVFSVSGGNGNADKTMAPRAGTNNIKNDLTLSNWRK